jgi:hypothetical protein
MNTDDSITVKAVALDVDGTLTDAKRRVNLKAVEKLRAVERRGIRVIIASGNVLPIASAYAGFIGASGPVVAENGGIVYYNREIKLLASRAEADEAFEYLKQHLPVQKIVSDRWRETEVAIQPNVELAEVKRLVENKYKNLKVGSTGFAIHINEINMDKFVALKIACEMLGIGVAEVLAIGDYANDLEMVKGCGIGVAVANASQELKAVADYVTTHANGAGVVEALERFLGV